MAVVAFCWVPCPAGWSAQNVPQSPNQNADTKVTFDGHIRPILMRRCSTCHNSDRTEADFNVTNFIDVMQGGGSGDVIQPFSATDSYLIGLVTHDESPEMPPSGNKIPDDEINLLKQWVNQGALENASSSRKKPKPKIDLSVAVEDTLTAPDPLPQLPRLAIEPQLHTARKSQVRSIAINPWIPVVAIAMPRQVLIFDSQNLKFKGVVPFAHGNPDHIVFSPNGSLLLMAGGVGGDSGTVEIWDVTQGKTLTTIGQELDSVLAADISPDHKWIALGGPKKVVRVYSVSDATLRYEITSHTQWITAIKFSPDGKQLLSADRNGGLIVTDAASGNKNFELNGHTGSITAALWRSDGKAIVSASEDETVRIWSSSNGKQIKSFKAHTGGVTDLAISNDGRILTTGRDNRVKRWKQNGSADGQFEGLTDIGMAVAWCATSKRMVAGDWRGEVFVWKLGHPQPIGEINSNPPPINDRIAETTQLLDEASDRLAVVEQRLQAELKILDRHRQQYENKTSQLAKLDQSTPEASRRAAEIVVGLGTIVQKIAALEEKVEPITKDRDKNQSDVERLELAINDWHEEAAFAQASVAENSIDDGDVTVIGVTTGEAKISSSAQDVR